MQLPAGRKADKISTTGRKAVLIPLFICLLAVFPTVRHTFEWLDFRFSDLLFSSLPILNLVSGRTGEALHPVLIINKDQTFFQRFQRDPDRADFASLTLLLNHNNAEVLAFDFIYDHAADPYKDEAFANALASFTLPLLATHFIGRGTQTFEKVEVTDSNSSRPPWPVPLYEPLAGKVATKGLINIAADLDSTVRFVPLAFHPADMDEFIPSLGFATWIATLISNQTASITKTLNNSTLSCLQQLDAVIAAAPFKFTSTGHDGLDTAVRRLELLYVARLLALKYPNLARDFNAAALGKKPSDLPTATWLDMPARPLPVIGNYELPCLRLPFTKLPPPFKGDGIETISMGTLLETESDRTSTMLNHRNMLDLESAALTHRIKLSVPTAKTGSCSLNGRVISVSGKPASGAEVLFIIPEQKFWTMASTDAQGNYSLIGLPEGDFTLQITHRYDSGWQKGILKGKTGLSSDKPMPLLMFADLSSCIKVPSEALSSDILSASSTSFCIFGEPMPMLTCDANGKIPLDALPEGFSISSFDEEQTIAFASGTLVNAENKLVTEQTVAVIPDNNPWLLRFFQQQRFLSASASSEFAKTPTSLDAQLVVLAINAENTAQKTHDLTLMPGESQNITELPQATRLQLASVSLSFDYQGPKACNLILLSETGENFTCQSDQTVSIPPGKYLILSELDGMRGLYKSSEITHKTIFVGSALPSDQDFVVTPVNFMDPSYPRIPGVNLHATLFSSLMRQSFIRSVPFHSDSAPRSWPLLQFLLLLPLLILLNRVFVTTGAIWGGISVMSALAAWLSLGTVMFMHQLLLPFFFPSLLLSSYGLVRGYLAWAISRQQEQQTRQTFGRFISSAVVEEILKTPDSLKPGGEKKELSIIFTDLAGFTSISEKLEPEQLTELMNEYLDEMTRILFRFGGTLDKYIGDAIMGFWNHPALQADHAQRAVECAICMQTKLAELRQKWLKQGLPSVDVRAGINSAICMVGFIGSDIQMNFTCLGDGVNLASRLEGANKAYGTLMMISDAVLRQIDQKLISTRFLDFLAVKGKDKPVEVFEVRGYRKNEPAAWLEAEVKYADGIKLYLNREWDAAISAFSTVAELLPDDGPAKVYIERCQTFKTTPPPEKWDGRYILKSK